MPGKDARSALQRRLEQGDTEHVVVVLSLTLLGVSQEGLATEGTHRAALEAALRKAVAETAGSSVSPDHVNLAFTPSEAAVAPEALRFGREPSKDSAEDSNVGPGSSYLAKSPASWEAAMRQAMAAGAKDEHDSPSAAAAKSTAVVRCTITPMCAMRPGAVSLGAGVGKALGSRIAKQLNAVPGLEAVVGNGVQVVDVVGPEVRAAFYPEIKLDRKHGIPTRVFRLYEDLQIMDDTRVVTGSSGAPSGGRQEAEEVEWSLQKTAELFKDPQLEKLFVWTISCLMKREQRNLQRWAASISPNSVRQILWDNPVKKDICSQPCGVHEQQMRLQAYAADCKLCIALALVAGDTLKRWQDEMGPEDKSFLGEAAEKLMAAPDLTVAHVRSLWDRCASRYVVVDLLARSAGTVDAALQQLRRCPQDVLSSCFKAPWREGGNKEASFFYVYQSFTKRSDCAAAEDFLDVLAKAFGAQPESDLVGTLRSYLEDHDVPAATRRDLLVSFVSICRLPRGADAELERPRHCCSFLLGGSRQKIGKDDVAPVLPDTAGLDTLALEVILKDYASREATDAGRGRDEGGDHRDADLAEMFEAVLLISSGDRLWSWAKEKLEDDPHVAEEAKRFLNIVAWRHTSDLLRSATAPSRSTLYDDARARELIEGSRPFAFSAVRAGRRFSEHAKLPLKRPGEELSQLLWMYFKLDFGLGAGSAWSFMQTLEEGSRVVATRLNRLAPPGSTLRGAMARDIAAACKGQLSEGDVEGLLRFLGFFNPSFQSFLRGGTTFADVRDRYFSLEASPSGVAAMQGLLTSLLEAAAKLIGASGVPADIATETVLADIAEHGCGHPVAQRLFSHVVEAVRAPDFQHFAEFGLLQLRECAKELGKAGMLLAHKLERKGATLALLEGTERTVQSFLKQSFPSSWASSFRSLDTVIFALEYMGKEDLQLAYDQFEAECRSQQNESLQELLECVRRIYSVPLAGDSLESITPNMDIGQVIRSRAPPLERRVIWRGVPFEPADWQRVLEIAGAAAESMRQRYNVLMLPHHTQMIALLMFAVRAAGARSVGAGPRRLPKTMLARVGTGEGKSLIIAMLAAFVAKRGLRAHVINDNRVLAQRDFDGSKAMFQALGIRASSDRSDLKNKDCKIVYCTGDDVEMSCLDNLIEGQVEDYEEGLKEAVLIVDEVDGLIFDKGTVSSQVFEDREFSQWANEWLQQLDVKGEVERDWDDFRSHGECSVAIQREVEEAYAGIGQKFEGRDYAVRGGMPYMLDPKTNLIQEGKWSLWLDVLKRHRMEGSFQVKYKYVKAILCRLQCFMSYSCIFGLTGSLGRNSEKVYLRDHYEAVTFNVPFFLDTCRAEPSSQDLCRPIQVGDKVTVLSENCEGVVELDRIGTCGLLGVVVDYRPADQEYKVELADGRALWYPETWVGRGNYQGRRAPTLVGESDLLPNGEEQERAVVSLAVGKCAEVPVLVLVKDSETVRRVAEQMRQTLWEHYGGTEDDHAVLELIHNPAAPQEFVETVRLATEPVGSSRAEGETAAAEYAEASEQYARQAWRITVTTAEGGRGHDYRVIDPAIDENGGLLLILTWVPWSEREWIQFLGRTGRQDHAGQYAVFLNAEDEQVQVGTRERKEDESNVRSILRTGDQETAKLLRGKGDEIAKGRLMHKLTSRFWTLHKLERTSKKQDWEWKRLCESYLDSTTDNIQQTFCNVIIPPKELVLGFSKLNKDAPARPGLAEQTCRKCGTVNLFPKPPEGATWPTVRCGSCDAIE